MVDPVRIYEFGGNSLEPTVFVGPVPWLPTLETFLVVGPVVVGVGIRFLQIQSRNVPKTHNYTLNMVRLMVTKSG